MDQNRARQLLESESILILKGLPRQSEFGFDGVMWLVDQFSGVKFIPSGLHMFVMSAAPTHSNHSTAPDAISSGIGTRHALLRWFNSSSSSNRDIVVDEWDNKQEHLQSELESRQRKRHRTVTNMTMNEHATIVSQDYLKTLDKQLAPYSNQVRQKWQPLISLVTNETVARVVGYDDKGNAHVEATMPSTSDEQELNEAKQKQTWGKPRQDDPIPTTHEVVDSDDDPPVEEVLKFVTIDNKRSWPQGAVGEDLTKWSKDKSWQLSQVVTTQLGGDVTQLLAELQLSFVLFVLVHNFSSLTTYKAIIALICHSPSFAQPPTLRHESPTMTRALLKDSALPLLAMFLTVLNQQLLFLDQSFFSEQMPSLDTFILQQLDALHANLEDAAPAWSTFDQISYPPIKVWHQLIDNWNTLSTNVMTRFGWELKTVRGSRRQGYAGFDLKQQQDNGEVDLEDLEEGEDAPVIVEM
ncbi:hypothetical protein OIO90_001949 [Microbotryomycetes sp. JL221]|nr:hypothetical protein OIO90_001949 [Microbotryomycetes sp. JL221]